jgi:signal transduction histidine kinase
MRLEESRTETLRAADSERHRLERDLHDGAQQRLVALLIRLRIASDQLERTPESTAAMLTAAEDELQVALDELRELSHGTHPAVLVDLGLVTAIRSVAARTSQRIHLAELPDVPLNEVAERTAYFVFLEAFTNAQKHAPDSEIDVRVRATERGLVIEVGDNGPGGAAEVPGRGLAGLRERVEEVGGSFGVRSIRGVGTTVTAVLPSS